MVKMRFITAAGMLVVLASLCVQAEFHPERIYKERTKTSLNFGWKFFLGEATGSPSDASYNDASWSLVNVPHSATYDPPTPEGERNAFQGVCWYRKTFTVPAAKHNGKIFIEFEAAMQIADVWLNGQKLGTHDNSGYTWFSFDVTDKVSLTESNVLAVRLDNQFNAKIPPGCGGAATGYYPDYYLFSGIYRDVWLINTSSCHIPLYGQKISVPRATASAAQSMVHVTTPVRNDDAEAKEVTVHYIFTDANNNSVFSYTSKASIEAGQSAVFSDTLGPFVNAQLWSPEHPYLYKLFTRVLVGEEAVDDNVERFGIRWYDWTPQEGFSLNGVPTIIRGANLHQSIAWVENAMPTSRFFKEVAMVKEMGANLIRGAHFPRDPSFYNACDELGMISMVEVPTWGTETPAYPDSFWIRENEVVREMIEVGFNHPSIIVWGLFNEPANPFDQPNQIPLLNKTAHELDPTRMTFMANNKKDYSFVFEADIVGLNYGTDVAGAIGNEPARTINTEYHEGWLYWCFRGDVNDNPNPGNYAEERWVRWLNILNYTGTNKLAGGCMWSFNDYWSPFMDHPMGVVDHFRIPKAAFYFFREKWTGVAADYPVAGLTSTQLVLTSDMEKLIADSTDIAIITAAFRDAEGKCVHTGYPEGTPVVFNVSGPADLFGETSVPSIAGKCAIVVKSKNTPGEISIAATGGGITSNTVTLNSVEPDVSPLPFISGTIHEQIRHSHTKVMIHQRASSLRVTFPRKTSLDQIKVSLFNGKGQVLSCPLTLKNQVCTIDLKQVPNGLYVASIKNSNNNASLVRRVMITK